MPAPLIGRKPGTGCIPRPSREETEGIKVLGLSGSGRQEPGTSESGRLPEQAPEAYRDSGCKTTFLRLKDLHIRHCEGKLLGKKVAIASGVGENDEDTTRDRVQIQANAYTGDDLRNMVKQYHAPGGETEKEP